MVSVYHIIGIEAPNWEWSESVPCHHRLHMAQTSNKASSPVANTCLRGSEVIMGSNSIDIASWEGDDLVP